MSNFIMVKNPENHFDEKPYLEQDLNFQVGVCVGDIQLKTGLAQSVISSYLLTMKKAGLLESDRIGKWTYYRRNEKQYESFLNTSKTNYKMKANNQSAY